MLPCRAIIVGGIEGCQAPTGGGKGLKGTSDHGNQSQGSQGLGSAEGSAPVRRAAVGGPGVKARPRQQAVPDSFRFVEQAATRSRREGRRQASLPLRDLCSSAISAMTVSCVLSPAPRLQSGPHCRVRCRGSGGVSHGNRSEDRSCRRRVDARNADAPRPGARTMGHGQVRAAARSGRRITARSSTNGRLYLIGGNRGGRPQWPRVVLEYDLAANRWSSRNKCPSRATTWPPPSRAARSTCSAARRKAPPTSPSTPRGNTIRPPTPGRRSRRCRSAARRRWPLRPAAGYT